MLLAGALLLLGSAALLVIWSFILCGKEKRCTAEIHENKGKKMPKAKTSQMKTTALKKTSKADSGRIIEKPADETAPPRQETKEKEQEKKKMKRRPKDQHKENSMSRETPSAEQLKFDPVVDEEKEPDPTNLDDLGEENPLLDKTIQSKLLPPVDDRTLRAKASVASINPSKKAMKELKETNSSLRGSRSRESQTVTPPNPSPEKEHVAQCEVYVAEKMRESEKPGREVVEQPLAKSPAADARVNTSAYL